MLTLHFALLCAFIFPFLSVLMHLNPTPLLHCCTTSKLATTAWREKKKVRGKGGRGALALQFVVQSCKSVLLSILSFFMHYSSTSFMGHYLISKAQHLQIISSMRFSQLLFKCTTDYIRCIFQDLQSGTFYVTLSVLHFSAALHCIAGEACLAY